VTSVEGEDGYGGRGVESKVDSGGPGYGDSGGPQMYEGRVVGVCSWGDYTNQVYASVAAHRDWIRETTGI
jgi:secreted trypsin-like serine protease